MNHEQLAAEAPKMRYWERHRYILLVGATIAVSFVLVIVAMMLYNSSGAAQLDLSRPGYVSVREQVDSSDKFVRFPSTGQIDAKSLDSFRALYTKQAQQATAVDSFGGDVMSDKKLSLDELPE